MAPPGQARPWLRSRLVWQQRGRGHLQKRGAAGVARFGRGSRSIIFIFTWHLLSSEYWSFSTEFSIAVCMNMILIDLWLAPTVCVDE